MTPAGSVVETIETTLAQWRPRLLELSRQLHSHPETAFAEHASAARVAELLAEAGFATEVDVYGLDTAIEAVSGTGEVTVVVCAEYDALPGLGHACGHNIIATAGVGAAIALAAVADSLGLRVKLLGTPAEEVGGGKALMLEAGAWEDATFSLMVHPMCEPEVPCEAFAGTAVDRFEITYSGHSTHAAAAPHKGVNAADAVTVAQVAIGLLRQQLADGVRVNAIVNEAGEVTNIIPAHARVNVEVRSSDLAELEAVARRVLACFEAGAVATGCSWQHRRVQPRYATVLSEPHLAAAWNEALSLIGRETKPVATIGGGSTDMGNVTQVVPAIHPMLAIPGGTAPPHTPQFAVDAGGPEGARTALDGAFALAFAAAAVASDPTARAELLERQVERPVGATTVCQDGALPAAELTAEPVLAVAGE